MSRHVCLVPFPELAEVVGPWLDHAVGGGPSNGIPPHVTLLAPAPGDAAGIGEALADVVWLAPEPGERFVSLTRYLWARFPDWPPYEGRFLPEVTPHLTVAWGALLDEAEAAVAPSLPLRGAAREAVLIREVAPRRWEPAASFPFREA